MVANFCTELVVRARAICTWDKKSTSTLIRISKLAQRGGTQYPDFSSRMWNRIDELDTAANSKGEILPYELKPEVTHGPKSYTQNLWNE